MTAIEISHLSKRYRDVVAVDDLSLSIAEGETFALLGVNGAGKTTTVKMLAGLTRPTSGDATVCGHSIVGDVAGVKKAIAISMQETAVARNLSVAENLALFADIYGLDKAAKEARIAALATEFGLGEVIKKRAKKLSGGWQRKLSIALALLAEPQVLFLDEPTLGLDVLARRELWRMLEVRKGRMTIVLTTHYMEEAEMLADRIGIMKGGRLVATGTQEELKKAAGCDKFEDAFVRLVEEGGAL